MSYDPHSRFYVDSVTGYPPNATGSHGREKTLWYVFDSVPPRLSMLAGFGYVGRMKAQQTAEALNRDEVAWWESLLEIEPDE